MAQELTDYRPSPLLAMYQHWWLLETMRQLQAEAALMRAPAPRGEDMSGVLNLLKEIRNRTPPAPNR